MNDAILFYTKKFTHLDCARNMAIFKRVSLCARCGCGQIRSMSSKKYDLPFPDHRGLVWHIQSTICLTGVGWWSKLLLGKNVYYYGN